MDYVTFQGELGAHFPNMTQIAFGFVSDGTWMRPVPLFGGIRFGDAAKYVDRIDGVDFIHGWVEGDAEQLSRLSRRRIGDMGLKKLVEAEDDGIEQYLGKRITLFCMNYIYTGTLSAVSDRVAMLDDPSIVYETGPFTDKMWKDAQALPNQIGVMLASVEAFGEVK